mmetsp:Transcript_914/g.2036  ORF Transcript_914/g.2036 Transcript_914/m.2036 type:complete len:303 (-) Transcript_914:24-932(-)
MPLSVLADELLRVLLAHEEGLSDDQVKQSFGDRYEKLAGAINELLQANRVQLFKQGNVLVYRAIKEETALKFEGLGAEEMLVHQVIERSGNKGIWTRDIKLATSIPQHNLTKTLKILEQRSLIKSVRSVVSKSKKLYVLFDVTPAKTVTGGPWYSDQEFDHEFVTALSDFIVEMVRSAEMMDLASISDRIKQSGISKIELSPEETELIVNTLVYDGRLEEIQSSVLLMSGYATGKRVYKVSKMIETQDYLTAAPCGVCPVMAQCCDGGVISPVTCPYLTDWLDDKGTREAGGGGSSSSKLAW